MDVQQNRSNIRVLCIPGRQAKRCISDQDRVFNTQSAQIDVYENAAKPVIEDVLNGYNGCLLAYGQTGAGKTHTMSGPSIDDEKLKGIIPRVMDDVFDYAMKCDARMEFAIRCSFVEIYLENIRDLLNPDSAALEVREDPELGVHVRGATEVYVTASAEMLEVMRAGSENRVVASTGMNQGSSRSHSMFIITLAQKNETDGSLKTSRLYLVDLAGSETVRKTGVKGQQLEEAKKINKSLSALGNVINALTDGRHSHIPYRDSKLTRVLQESLGGNSRTALIINCSPSAYNEMETLSTLRFGARAKRITNKAKINQQRSPEEMARIIEQLEARIERYKVTEAGLRKLLADNNIDAASVVIQGGGGGGGDGELERKSMAGAAATDDGSEGGGSAGDRDDEAKAVASGDADGGDGETGDMVPRSMLEAQEAAAEDLRAQIANLSAVLADVGTNISNLQTQSEEEQQRRREAEERAAELRKQNDEFRELIEKLRDGQAQTGEGDKPRRTRRASTSVSKAELDNLQEEGGQATTSAGSDAGDAKVDTPAEAAEVGAAAQPVDSEAGEDIGAADDNVVVDSKLLTSLKSNYRQATEENEDLRRENGELQEMLERLRDQMGLNRSRRSSTQLPIPNPSGGVAGTVQEGDNTTDAAAAATTESDQTATAVSLDDALQVTVDVYENQRHYPRGWTADMLAIDPPAWSDDTGKINLPKDQVELPSADWFWLSDWKEVKSGDADDAGWVYGTTFDEIHVPRGSSRKEAGMRDVVRRRKWSRTRAKIDVSSPDLARKQFTAVAAQLQNAEDEIAHVQDENSRLQQTLQMYEQRFTQLMNRQADAVTAGDIGYLNGGAKVVRTFHGGHAQTETPSSSPSKPANNGKNKRGFFKTLMNRLTPPKTERPAAQSPGGSALKSPATSPSALWFLAIENEKMDVMGRMVAEFRDVEDSDGRCGVHYAARAGKTEVLDWLVNQGAESDAMDNTGRNGLHYAVRRGHMDAAVYLLSRGLPPNQCDSHGLSPLHQAVLGRHKPLSQLLLERGADPYATDTNGHTALDLARRFDYKEMIVFLTSWLQAHPEANEKVKEARDREAAAAHARSASEDFSDAESDGGASDDGAAKPSEVTTSE